MSLKLAELQQRYSPNMLKVEELELAPRKSDKEVRSLSLVWLHTLPGKD